MGVLALGAAPADAPTFDRRAPATSVTTPAPAGLDLQQPPQRPAALIARPFRCAISPHREQ